MMQASRDNEANREGSGLASGSESGSSVRVSGEFQQGVVSRVVSVVGSFASDMRTRFDYAVGWADLYIRFRFSQLSGQSNEQIARDMFGLELNQREEYQSNPHQELIQVFSDRQIARNQHEGVRQDALSLAFRAASSEEEAFQLGQAAEMMSRSVSALNNGGDGLFASGQASNRQDSEQCIVPPIYQEPSSNDFLNVQYASSKDYNDYKPFKY